MFLITSFALLLRLCKNFKLFRGLHGSNAYLANGYPSSSALVRLAGKLAVSNKGVGRARATLVSEEGDLLSYTNGNNGLAKNTLISDESVGIEMQPDAVAFGALSADTAPTTSGFPVDNDEFDLDRPTKGFASIPEAIEDIRQGKVVTFLSFVLL